MLWMLGCLTSPGDYAELVAQAQDADGDGQASVDYGGLDCDDLAPETYAGAPEQCDGLDNDCDQDVDEDVEGLSLFFLDEDNDGYGSGDTSLAACEAPLGFVAVDGDCDDSNPAVRPGEVEVCGNGVDDDCSESPEECWDHGAIAVSEMVLGRSITADSSIAFWPWSGSLLVAQEAGLLELELHGDQQLVSGPGAETMLETGIGADTSIVSSTSDGTCLSEDVFLKNSECPLSVEIGEERPLVLGRIFCAAGGALRCTNEVDAPELLELFDRAASGVGPFSGGTRHLGTALGASVSIYSEADLLGEALPSASLTLPATPTSLCLLNQAVVWADASGTHLTSAAGETQLLTESAGAVSCMEAGSEYVLIIPPSNDQLVVVNLSGLGDPAWGAPLVVTLPEADDLLPNKATLAQGEGQAYLFVAHGSELRRLELGLGL